MTTFLTFLCIVWLIKIADEWARGKLGMGEAKHPVYNHNRSYTESPTPPVNAIMAFRHPPKAKKTAEKAAPKRGKQ